MIQGQDQSGSSGLTEERIQFTDEALDWKTAVRRCGAPLVEQGAVESSYVEAVIETAQKMGPYFDLGKGIAMPHARPEAGANAQALAMLRTRTPVLLLDQADHAIDVFIMLAATDTNSHLAMLQKLAGVLTDDARVERMKAATTAAEVLAVFDEA
ncbi:MAG: PTS sugar transporter subunit IIA [Micropruina sp.]|uniref:PTS sugar transporter subunit IIA n=1 Tax=Micropruina sp. TaxID=2737536 RepID=UPI0039E5FDBB